MKKIICLILSVLMLFGLCSCNTSVPEVKLEKDMDIPGDGIVSKEILQKIKDEKSIGTFTGKSNDYKYTWTVFGKELGEVKDVNLALSIEEVKEKTGVAVVMNEKAALGFSVNLSVTLKDKWDAKSAVVYKDGAEVSKASVSVNKDGVTVINLTLKDDIFGEFYIYPEIEQEQEQEQDPTQKPEDEDDREMSDGSQTEKDEFETDPVPEGKPLPVEPEDQNVDKDKVYKCTISIECSTILNNLDQLDPDKLEMVPADGVILKTIEVTFNKGESVFDVLKRVCKENKIHMEYSFTPMYNSAYIEGIHNLYEFDCGSLSGWMYRVNGWYPNYGVSRYQLAQGDVIEFRYTCDLGHDVGCDFIA